MKLLVDFALEKIIPSHSKQRELIETCSRAQTHPSTLNARVCVCTCKFNANNASKKTAASRPMSVAGASIRWDDASRSMPLFFLLHSLRSRGSRAGQPLSSRTRSRIFSPPNTPRKVHFIYHCNYNIPCVAKQSFWSFVPLSVSRRGSFT